MSIDDINMIQNECHGMFNLLQQLQLPVTENNVAILNACLGSLKLIGKTLEESKKEAEPDGEADTCEPESAE